MVLVVTGLAKRDQVIRAIAAGLAAFNVVNIQDFVLAVAFWGLAPVSVPVKDVFPDIPESGLVSILVSCSFYIRVFDLLNVESCDFDNHPVDRKDRLYVSDQFLVAVQFVLNGRGEPAFRLPAVIKPRLPIPCFAVTSVPAVHSPFTVQIDQVFAKLHICRVNLFRACDGGKSYMSKPAINAQRNRLDVPAASVDKPDHKRCPFNHGCLARR